MLFIMQVLDLISYQIITNFLLDAWHITGIALRLRITLHI